MIGTARRRFRRLIISLAVSVLAFAAPPAIMAAATPPALPVYSPACAVGGVLSSTQSCVDSLASAKARWPTALLPLDGTTSGNGSWIVPDGDGLHFDLVTVSIETTSTNAPSVPAHVALSRQRTIPGVMSALALSVISSGSGHLNTSGFSCGNWINWSGYVKQDMWYLTHLEMDVGGHLIFCSAAYNARLTPVVYGAGSWTYSSGTIGNGTTRVNPWINWYGTIFACCSDTVLERYYMDAWGNWSWKVYE